ncbi:hypothetical protein ACMD2_14068 [Ananas comosus]|uniref:Uncharacterized protein n=1 Tax=Ananas comosus TaxID=4615 RepID=A0A199W4C8_ANACO|nr:hypothetical protein ACMD2_14068 [Ananas comosus]
MKASIKFREEKNPLVRTKVPISVLGLPLVSGLAVGDTGELRVDLATAFDFGPSLRVSYRPTDPWRPFSLVLKTRPSAAAPMAMTAEFSPLGRGGAGPSFSVLFKPRFGDFAITKSFRSSSSPVALGATTNGEGAGKLPIVDYQPLENGFSSNSGKKAIGEFPANDRRSGIGWIGGLFSGMEVIARSVLPLRRETVLKLRWGVRVPPELRSVLTDDGRRAPMTGTSLSKLPLLVLNKISIEHAMDRGKEKEKEKEKKRASEADTAPSDAPEAVKRQLEVLQGEHGSLRQSLEELHAKFIDRKMAPVVAGRVSGIADISGKGGVPPPLLPAGSGNRENWDRQGNRKSPENSGEVVRPELGKDEGRRNAK